MAKVTITALPRQGYRGFGAIGRYFLSGLPEQLEVNDVEYAELNSDPASFFLKVEDGWPKPVKASPTPATPPAKPTE